MKKIVVILLAVIGIVSLLMVGSALEPAAVAKEKEGGKGVTKWIGETDIGPGDPMFTSAQRMCEAITTASGGRLKLTVEPAVDAWATFDAVDAGTIDFAFSLPDPWRDKFPAAGLFSTRAGGMSPKAKYLWFISGGGAELAQQMIAAYDVQLIPGGGYLSTPETFLHSRYPINILDDLVGLKLRAIGDGGEILSIMRAEVVSLPGAEIYKAMENKWIDAFEFAGPYTNWQYGFQEVADYVYVSGCRVPHDLYHFIVNQTRWNELPDDLQRIVEQVSNVEVITSYNEQCQLDVAFLAAFWGYGCVVETLSSEIEEAFVLEANEYYDEQAEGDTFYTTVLESLRDFEADFEEALAGTLGEAIRSYAEQCE